MLLKMGCTNRPRSRFFEIQRQMKAFLPNVQIFPFKGIDLFSEDKVVLEDMEKSLFDDFASSRVSFESVKFNGSTEFFVVECDDLERIRMRMELLRQEFNGILAEKVEIKGEGNMQLKHRIEILENNLAAKDRELAAKDRELEAKDREISDKKSIILSIKGFLPAKTLKNLVPLLNVS